MDRIVLNGNAYRVEVNWNAIVAFLEASGRDDVRALMDLGTIRPSDLAGLMAAGINEGERLEGRESHLTAEDVGATADFGTMAEFIQIFVRQTSAKGTEEEKKE